MLKREFKMKNGRYNMNKQSTKKLVIYGVIGLFLIITIFDFSGFLWFYGSLTVNLAILKSGAK